MVGDIYFTKYKYKWIEYIYDDRKLSERDIVRLKKSYEKLENPEVLFLINLGLIREDKELYKKKKLNLKRYEDVVLIFKSKYKDVDISNQNVVQYNADLLNVYVMGTNERITQALLVNMIINNWNYLDVTNQKNTKKMIKHIFRYHSAIQNKTIDIIKKNKLNKLIVDLTAKKWQREKLKSVNSK